MNIIYTKSYDKSLKSLKRHHDEMNLLNEIIDTIKRFDSFDEMIKDPLLSIYNFERLKYDNSELYSFRLSKVIRLIVKPCDDNCSIFLIYISMKHYDDFDLGRVIYYDE